MLKGTYKVFKNQSEGQPWLAARFMVNKQGFRVLEDHLELFESLNEGPVFAKHEKFISSLMHSSIYHVVKEDAVDKGEHEHLIPELDLGSHEPDHEYILVEGEGLEPKRIEVFDSRWVIDGKPLGFDEQESFFEKVKNGQFKLYPL